MSGTARNVVQLVASGKAFLLKAGQWGVVKAPNLTVCSAIALRAVNSSGKQLGIMVAHRGGQGNDAFRKELRDAAQSLDQKDVKWQVVGIQTARNTDLSNTFSQPDAWGDTGQASQSDSLSALVSDVSSVFKDSLDKTSADMLSMAETGSKQSLGVKQMIVTVEPDGKTTVEQFKGPYITCTIQ